MPRFGDIDLILNETLRVARVLEVQKAGKILLGMPFTGMRKNDMVDRFVQEFHRRFVSRDEQNDILYRFQTECLDHHTALSRLSEKYRVKLSREISSSNSGRTSNNRGGMVNGGPSSNSAAPSVTSNSSVSHQYQQQSNVRNAVAAAYASHAASNSATNHFNYNVAPHFPPPSSIPSSLPNISAATSSHSATQQSDNLPYSPFLAGGVPANIPSPYYRAPLPHRPPPHRMPFVMQARQQFANHTSSGPSFRGAMPPQQPSATSSSDQSWRQPHYAGGRFNFQAVPSSNIQSSSSYSHPSAPQYFAPPLADYNASNYMYPASSSAAAETPQLLNSTAPLTTIVAKQVYTSYYDAELALRPYGFRMDSVTIPSTSMLSPAPPNYSPMMKDLPRILYARIKHQARMPFYRNIEILVPPIRLHNVMSVKSAAYLMGSLRFAHSPDRLLLSSNNTSESRTDLLIRFFKIDENETQLDTLPPNVTVEIRSAANRVGGMNAGPPALTLYRTTLVRFKKTKPKHEKPIIIPSDFAARERQIEVLITYTPSESDYEFAVGIFRAQTVSIEEEVASIRQKPLDSSLSRQSILRELKPNAAGGDDDIGAAEVSSLPLKCPISKLRIKVPCRALQCTVHHTCDAYSFVEMNFERPTWRCFLCNRDVYLQDLRFELFVDDLLKKMVGTSETVNFVLNKSGNDLMIKQDLSSEGSGVALSTSSESAGSLGVAKKSAKVSTSSSKNDAESSRRAGTTATAKDDVICLSSSDDEDKMKSEDMDVVSSPEQGKRRGKKLSPSDGSETSSRLENQESQAAEFSSSSDEGEGGDKSENDASSPDVDVAANPAHSNSEIPPNRPRSRTTAAVLNRRFQMMKKRIRPANKNSARSSKTAAVSLFASTSSAATASKKSNLHSTVDASGHEVIDLTLSSSDEETPASLSTNANSGSRRSSASTVATVSLTNSSAASKSAVAAANERRAAAGSSSSQSSVASTSMPPAVRTPTTPSSCASMLSANVLVADAVVDGLIAVMNRGQADRRVSAPPSASSSAAAVDASNRTAPSSAYQQYAASRNAASSMPQSYPTLPADAFSMSPYGAPMLVSPLPPSPSAHRQITASPTTGSNYLQNMPLLPPPPPLTIHVVHTQQQPPSYGPPRFARQSSQSSLSSAPQPLQLLPPPLAPVNLHLIPMPSPRIISQVDSYNSNSNITLPSYNGTPMSTPAHSHQNSPGHQQQQSSSFAIQQSVANFDRALSISSKSPRNMDTEAVSSTSPTPTDAGTINTHSSPPLSFDSNSNVTDNDRTPTTDTTTARSSGHTVNSAASAEENFDDLMDGMEEIDESVIAAMFGTDSSYTLSDSRDMDALPVGGSVAMKSAIATSSMSKSDSSVVNHKSSSHERTENARGSSQHDASFYQATTSGVAAEPSEAEKLKDVRLRLKMSFVNGKAASAAVLGNDSSARAASNSHKNSSEYSSKPTQAVTESLTRSVGNKLTFRLTSAAASTAAAAQPPAVEVRRPPSFNKTGTSAAAVVSRTSASSPGASRRSSIVPLDLDKRAGSATTKNAASLNSAVDKTAHVPPLTIRLAPSSSKSATIARAASPIAASPPPDADGFSSIPWASSPEDNENTQDAAKSSRKSSSSSSSSSDDDGFSARRRRRRDKRRVPPLALKLRNAPLHRRVAVNDENSNSPIPSDIEIAESATTSRRAPNNSSSKSKRGQPQKRKTAASRNLGEEQSDDEGERTNDTFENLNEMLEDFGDEDDNVLQPAFPKLAVKCVEPARSEGEAEEADDDRNVASRSSYNTAASRCSSSNEKNRRPQKNKTVVADEDDDDDATPARSRSNATLKYAKRRSRRRKASQDEDANSGSDDEQQLSFQRVSYSAKHGAYDADLIAPSSEEDQQQSSDSSSSSDSEDEPSVPVPKISVKALPKSAAPAVRKRAKIVGSDDDDDEDADSDPDFNPARKSQADDQDSIWIGKRKNAKLCNGRNSTTGIASTGAAAAAKRRRVQIAADDSDDEGEREAAVLSKRNAKHSKLKPLATASRTATRRAGRVITPENRSKAKSRHNDDDDKIDDDNSLNDFIAADSGDES